MPPRRLRPIARPVRFVFDGALVEGDDGESLAVALYAAGHLILGRSTKYHRPRGAYCLRGRCDGCLARVDGIPNVMTCCTRARDGARVEAQNVVGSAEADFLGVTDWFFPRGMDHHHMFTRYKSMNRAMQKVARRLAGIGRLPATATPPAPARVASIDVLVVGAGASGLAAATAAAEAGAVTWLVEEEPAPGGALSDWSAGVSAAGPVAGSVREAAELASALARNAERAGARVFFNHTAFGIYTDPPHVLVGLDGPEEALRVWPRRVILATGTHDGSVALEGGDLPGVISSRAAARLLRHGVAAGERVVLVGADRWTAVARDAYARHGIAAVEVPSVDRLLRVRGTGAASHVDVVGDDGVERTRLCDAVILAAPATAASELAGQAGVPVRFDGERFVAEASERDGKTAVDWVHVIGACAGVERLDVALAQGTAAGRACAEEVRAHRG